MNSTSHRLSFTVRTLLFLLAFGLIIPASVISEETAFKPVVILENGFEDGKTQNWVTRGGGGAASSSKDVAHSGASSLKMTGRTLDWHMPRIELTGTFVRGSKYSIELWARLPAGEKDAAMNLTMLTRYAEKDVETPITEDIPAKASAWTKLTGEFVWDPAAAGVFLYVYNKGPSLSDYYIDDVKITQIAEKAAIPGAKLEAFTYDFEKNGAQGWGPRGGVQTGTAKEAAHSGALGLATSSRSETWNGPAINMTDTLKVGAGYSFTAYLKLASAPAAPATVKFTMEEKASGKTSWKTIAQAEVKDDKWVKLAGSYSFTTSMDALSLYAESSNSSDVIYIDDILIEMVSAPPPAPAISIQKNLKALKESFYGYFVVGAAINAYNIQGVPGELVAKHFNSVVAENAMKPLYIQPTEGNFYWDEADQIVAFAKKNSMVIRFHTLLWHSQVPAWFFIDKDGKKMIDETDTAKRAANKKLLLQRVESHVTACVNRYKNDIRSWDVVNEVIDTQGPLGMRDSEWFKISGTDYIETAFRAARAAGGDKVKLFINDYGTEDPKKRDILYKLVKDMLAKGVPIDGVGHQTHITLTYPPLNYISDSIKLFGNLGLDNQITELDVSVYPDNLTSYATVSAELLAAHGYRYKELFDTFKSLNKEISSVTLWGIGDSGSWLQNRPIKRTDAPLLFDNNFQAKPAYFGLVDPTKLPPAPPPPKPKAPPKVGEAIPGTAKVDGVIEPAWNKAKAMDVTVPAGGKTASTAKARAMWDTDFLYVLMEVSDALLNEASVNAYEQDSVEVFLDENNGKTEAYQGDDGQYRVSFSNKKSFGSNGESKGMTSEAVLTKDGYIVEMAIPFRTVKGAKNLIIGFDAQINDADATGKRIAIVKWNDDTDLSYKNTVNFGTLKLVP